MKIKIISKLPLIVLSLFSITSFANSVLDDIERSIVKNHDKVGTEKVTPDVRKHANDICRSPFIKRINKFLDTNTNYELINADTQIRPDQLDQFDEKDRTAIMQDFNYDKDLKGHVSAWVYTSGAGAEYDGRYLGAAYFAKTLLLDIAADKVVIIEDVRIYDSGRISFMFLKVRPDSCEETEGRLMLRSNSDSSNRIYFED
ncbi:MAG: hypothetical protein A2504_13560 [Bdellovibrionales bacterium RIFOXYD12_FULL_39_22]|nr:MAG: hypothetical protein A2385_00285 [Bdellovibrionales bacterium RIFOXYB1_FULL_39_21]OFZ43885.1 MAG: hypothetical protein A2485_05245 [Bdellovibrionales bacterium RIFOXYC12_FULL_39_17]OFZ48781.1 MAG: hypothetical protein A2404_17600 [Bdellovibrionales bacterium RIFOXYC1_FULL_39_130]OFZ71403.1 MAG: hypothetical protein A2451_05235 [Bdellovibrionales bacterium RIFOXYC2_FULL_39_8]OFZ76514.1 MAG: hypothetical protein A2560_06265 [Bdellovibrionales bacterium RIFOXYD1_FULL_39_84]OFZ94748.1 MAG: